MSNIADAARNRLPPKRFGTLSSNHQEIDTLLADSGLATELGFVMRMAQLATFDNLASKVRETGLTLSQLALIRLINTQQGLRQQQISDALKVKKTNLVTMVDRLESLGLVERQPSPTDKRAHALYLTAEGKRTVTEAMKAVGEHLQLIDSFLTPAEQNRLLTLLTKLGEGFEACRNQEKA